MKKLLKYFNGYKKECVLGPLFKLFEATLELIVPLVIAAIIDQGIGNGDGGYVVRMCLWLLAVLLRKGGSRICNQGALGVVRTPADAFLHRDR